MRATRRYNAGRKKTLSLKVKYLEKSISSVICFVFDRRDVFIETVHKHRRWSHADAYAATTHRYFYIYICRIHWNSSRMYRERLSRMLSFATHMYVNFIKITLLVFNSRGVYNAQRYVPASHDSDAIYNNVLLLLTLVSSHSSFAIRMYLCAYKRS